MLTTPRNNDHLLGTLIAADGTRWFLKAFAPGQEGYFDRELAVYRAARSGTVPKLLHADRRRLILLTCPCDGGRLGDLDADAQDELLDELAPLYGRLLDLPVGSTTCQSREGFHTVCDAVRNLPGAEALPSAGIVLELLAMQRPRPVHGDFHPLNVLVDGAGLRAVDFESYGVDLPGFDIARMSFNPTLRLDMWQRRELARTLSAVLGEGWVPSDRELAACCVYWAVSCAAYFSAVLADSPAAAMCSPEVPVLATEPLLWAAELWNGEL